MEPLASPTSTPPALPVRLDATGEALEIGLPARSAISGLRLWTQEGSATDQLIQVTEGVLVEEHREPREYVALSPDVESARTIALTTGKGREVQLALEQRGPRHLLVRLEASGEPLRLGASWTLEPREHLTGLGCRHGLRFDQTGRRVMLGADRRYTGPDCPPDMLDLGGVPMGDYVPVPWLLSSEGWAVWIEGEGHAIEFDLSSEVAVSVRSASGPLRMHLMLDETPAALLRHYCRLTGFPQILPEWGYGHWKSRDVYKHEREVLEDFDEYREHELPLDAIVLDSPWETQYNTWEFNPWQFSDPKGLIRRMRADGVRTVVWTTPWVNLESVDGQRPPDEESERTHRAPAANYAEGERAGHYVRGSDGEAYVARWWMGTGSPIDFTSRAARGWWIEQARRVLRMGVEGIKADDGEGYYFPDDVRFADGRRGAEAAWAYPRMYRETMQEALDAEHPGSGVLFSRSGASGSQAPGLVWGGDQVSDFWSLRTLVAATMTAAASAISNWSCDVGGYLGKRLVERCDPELLVRWAQFGCFNPLMQAHGRFDQEAWRYSPEIIEIFREAVLLHERLVPYILSAARTAHRAGLPIIRPLPLVDPGDATGWTLNDAYMFGPSLWVAPVLEEGADRRHTYLPRGTWLDFWTGARTQGGREVVVPAPLDRIPLWVRAGSIVPTHPAASVASGLGEDGVATRPVEATLWGRPTTGRAKVRLRDGTGISWSETDGWKLDRPEGAPPRRISFHCASIEPALSCSHRP